MTGNDRAHVNKSLETLRPRRFDGDRGALAYLREHAPRLSRSQRDAVETYSGDTFYTLNRSLREGDTSSPLVKQLDNAMAPTEHDLSLTRHVGPEAFGLTSQNIDHLKELHGQVIADDAYSSTALGSTYGGGLGGVTLRVLAPAGTPALFVAPHSSNPHEREVLLPRGMRLVVVKVGQNDQYGYTVTAVPVPGTAEHASKSDPLTASARGVDRILRRQADARYEVEDDDQ